MSNADEKFEAWLDEAVAREEGLDAIQQASYREFLAGTTMAAVKRLEFEAAEAFRPARERLERVTRLLAKILTGGKA